AARVKMRTVRLLTLGLSTWSLIAVTGISVVSVRVFRRAVVRERRSRAGDHHLDGIGEVDLRDVVVAPREAELMRLEQHVGMRVPEGRLETVGRELDQEAERVGEVDRVHEAAVDRPAVLDAALVESLDGLPERRLRERERQVVHAAGLR